MASNTKRYPKLRFALITADALEKLRPETKPQEPHLMEVKDIYETISNTVNVVIEQKLKHLKLDKLDQLIEAKVCEFYNRQRRQRTLPSAETPKSSPTEESLFADFGIKATDFDIREIKSKAFRNARAEKVNKKEPFSSDFPCKTKKTSDRKASVVNNKNLYRYSNRRVAAPDLRKYNSTVDMAERYFRHPDH